MPQSKTNSTSLPRGLLRAWIWALSAALPVLLAAGPAAGQAPTITPFAGVGIGGTQLPRPIVNLCGDGSTRMFAVEAVAGASSGALRFEVRADAAHALIFAGCDPAGPFHDSGTHTDRIYHADRRYGDRSLAAHVRFAPPQAVWSLGIGSGRLINAAVPFVAGTASLRARGRAAWFVTAQLRQYRLSYDDVTTEWRDHAMTREISRQPGHEWRGGMALTGGIEFRIR
jgi:hypothetical protein